MEDDRSINKTVVFHLSIVFSMTTPILFREYVWLVNTIYQARRITLEELLLEY